jgi:hypothetical protein
MPTPRPTLLAPIYSLTSAFAAGASPSIILTHFTTSPPPVVHEYGNRHLQSQLPFIGRDFIGLSGVGEYFDLLAEHLSYSDMGFDSEDDWVVDPQNMTVCLRGCARFTHKATGQSWNEVFMWRVSLSEDLGESEPDPGQGLKVQDYRVWADTGAAFLASRGEWNDIVAQGRGEDGQGKSISQAATSREPVNPIVHRLGDGLSCYGSCG